MILFPHTVNDILLLRRHPGDGGSRRIIVRGRQCHITITATVSQCGPLLIINHLIEGMVRFMNQDEFIGPVNMGNPASLR